MPGNAEIIEMLDMNMEVWGCQIWVRKIKDAINPVPKTVYRNPKNMTLITEYVVT